MTNLIHNAQQHALGPVEVTARPPQGGQIRIQVRDHGPGFPPDFLPHAFDRFTQADRARATTGAGLGLAITAAIVRSCGGDYGATNHPDGGATAWITLLHVVVTMIGCNHGYNIPLGTSGARMIRAPHSVRARDSHAR